MTQSCFAVAKNIRLDSMYYFIMKIPNNQKLQQIAFNNLPDIEFKDFINLYKKNAQQNHIPVLEIESILVSNNPLCFRMNLLERI